MREPLGWDTYTPLEKLIEAIERLAGDDFYTTSDINESEPWFDMLINGEPYRVTLTKQGADEMSRVLLG